MWLEYEEYEGHEKNLALGVRVLGSDPIIDAKQLHNLA